VHALAESQAVHPARVSVHSWHFPTVSLKDPVVQSEHPAGSQALHLDPKSLVQSTHLPVVLEMKEPEAQSHTPFVEMKVSTHVLQYPEGLSDLQSVLQ